MTLCDEFKFDRLLCWLNWFCKFSMVFRKPSFRCSCCCCMSRISFLWSSFNCVISFSIYLMRLSTLSWSSNELFFNKCFANSYGVWACDPLTLLLSGSPRLSSSVSVESSNSGLPRIGTFLMPFSMVDGWFVVTLTTTGDVLWIVWLSRWDRGEVKLGDVWDDSGGDIDSCFFGIFAGTGDVDDVISFEPDWPSGLIGAADDTPFDSITPVVSGELLRNSGDSLFGVDGRSCLIWISHLMTELDRSFVSLSLSKSRSRSRSFVRTVCRGASATFGW